MARKKKEVTEEVAEKAPAAAKMSLVKAAPAAVQNEEGRKIFTLSIKNRIFMQR